ncbi:hypothetical protein Pcinc_032707 [Petrolisthes cinctipes]|uniref:Uncharacterized protein n=1 Tax=Petrolisthes cinctipes TaxID=88211 RepID=A0AAE1EU03_PETCI|nr:hypothetical protein Pcinc_032707 [Petrolisthes cinctipes]
MNKICELLLGIMMGVGPLVMFGVLTMSYGRHWLIGSLILSGLYVVIVAFLLCFCMRRYSNPYSDDDPQVIPPDLPPSYEDVTSKPPSYSTILFNTAPPTGDDAWPSRHEYSNGGYVPIHSHPMVSCPLPIHLHADAPPPSYTEAAYGGGTFSPCGTSSCGTVFPSTTASSPTNNTSGTLSALESVSSGTKPLNNPSVNNNDCIIKETNSPAYVTTPHQPHHDNFTLATRVFVIPLRDPPPSYRPHCNEIGPPT